jgi:transcriptional regulator with XRE-family HTH domain
VNGLNNTNDTNVNNIYSLSSFLKMIMKAERLSNRELAKRAFISEGAVRNILKYGTNLEKSKPDIETLIHISKALNINPSILFELSDVSLVDSKSWSPMARYIADVYDSSDMEIQSRIIDSVLIIMSDGNETVSKPANLDVMIG